MVPAPLDRDDLRQRVGKALAAFLSGQAPRLDAISEQLGPLQDALGAFLLDGGKRLRPAFCYWGFRGAGGSDSDAVVTAAASLELLQACALIHDDVMDGSDTRRGQPAMHRRFAALHRGEDWHGDPEAFGLSAAVLLGDLCLIWADELLNTSGMPADALLRAQPVYDEMRVELMAGQYLDLLEQALGGGTVESALRVARYKSAKYTIEKPLHMGAALAGAPQEVLDGYSGYGLPLGEAFQLRDDVLGVFGDPATTGKPAGDDLREGKRTALVAMALGNATPAQTALVRRHLGDPHLSETGVAELRQIICESGALDRVEQLIGELMDKALAALQAAPVEAEARTVLEELAVAATARAV
ncbi:MAG: polyprenyl synthetase family protein [Actinobacteria bacterium]|nr:polyprenyl synthetase family protein [Actinomycetota bacterium]MCA1720010.1 polyprenyl synthetase family protein [Actinomycetota bacterium]